MKVLHVLSSLDQAYGGPVRLVMDLSARCLPLGLDSEVLGFGELNMTDNPFPPHRIHSLPVRFLRSYAYSPCLRAWISSQIDRFQGVIIHGAWTYPGRRVAESCRERNIPYAIFPHGMLEPWTVNGQGSLKSLKKHAYWKLVEKHTFLNARCLFFTTRRERTLANLVFHLPSNQIVLSPYGTESPPEPSIRPKRSDLEHLSRANFALFLGRLHPKKNVDFLLRAWHKANPPESWRLVIAGPDDGHLPLLQALVRQLGLSAQVDFLGFVAGNDKRFLLQNARWFLLPSKQENFGVAVLEAINHGCPVAISDQVHISESFPQGAEVLTLEMDLWVKFVADRMQDSEWREHVLARDRAHLAPQFEISRVSQAWNQILQVQLSSGAPARS
jgi:glycosyltransferase involved in cell wall biosynthesis